MERIRVHLEKSSNDSYDIFIGQGVMDHVGAIIKTQNKADRHVIITDSMVKPLYGELVKAKLEEEALPADLIEVPAGESSKSMATVIDVARQLLKLNTSRKTLLVALGGGVVGDLTGFVASIYKRAIPYVQIATSLVAQVDSSVGGKTGVDLPEGKNLLGTFYQPKAVFIDLAFLKTLSERDFKNGLAEIIKYAIINNGEMFNLLEQESTAIAERQPALMQKLIEQSCGIKARIVELDEHEGGLRRILNYGHTIGHALEAASNYGLSHGEAVAIGMVAAAKLSFRLGCVDAATRARIARVIRQYGLPTQIPRDFDTTDILKFMASDKKTVAGQPHFVLIRKIGTPFVTADVPLKIITDVIAEMKQ